MATSRHHFEKNHRIRRINEMLLNLSEEHFDEDGSDKVSAEPVKESWTAWQKNEATFKQAAPRRRKNIPPVPQGLEEMSTTHGSEPSSARHRNFELEFVNSPLWRIGFEPNSGRYILGNGRYRAHKLAQSLAKERDLHRYNGRFSLEQKTLMALIQKFFKREFEVFLRYELQGETKKRNCGEKERTRKHSVEHMLLNDLTPDDIPPPPERNVPHLPPLRGSRASKAEENKAYVNQRLGVLNEELRHIASDTKLDRSQSEPPLGLGSLVDPLGQRSNGFTRQSGKTQKEEVRNRVQVQELADHLILALGKLKQTRDEDLRRRFQDNEVNRTPEAPATRSDLDLSERPLRRLHIEPLPQLVQSGQNIKYQTNTGDIISVPRFGQYPGLDGGVDTKNGRRRDPVVPRKKKSEAPSGNNPTLNGTISDQILQSVITTTKYTPSDVNFCIRSKSDSERLEDISGMVVDGFQPMSIGKPRHRQKRPSSPPIPEHHKGILPEISGKSVKSNRVQ